MRSNGVREKTTGSGGGKVRQRSPQKQSLKIHKLKDDIPTAFRVPDSLMDRTVNCNIVVLSHYCFLNNFMASSQIWELELASMGH